MRIFKLLQGTMGLKFMCLWNHYCLGALKHLVVPRNSKESVHAIVFIVLVYLRELLWTIAVTSVVVIDALKTNEHSFLL
ncbi:unnamed protein product [Schistosoma curassoni]|uniref:Secreted protein n=1 Tax=Schistosoma curassoni TaxID=6186 RepID=A0A183L242_9TREM|nr:unnamed protein product [Schistosoma curassoni]